LGSYQTTRSQLLVFSVSRASRPTMVGWFVACVASRIPSSSNTRATFSCLTRLLRTVRTYLASVQIGVVMQPRLPEGADVLDLSLLRKPKDPIFQIVKPGDHVMVL